MIKISIHLLIVDINFGMNRGVYRPPSAHRMQRRREHDMRCLVTEKYSRRIDANFSDQEGRNALHLTIIQGHEEDIEHALRAGCDVNAQDRLGRRPIHYAAERGFVLGIKKLITYGAELNVLCKEGQTPLMRAAHSGHVEVMRMLIKAGAKVSMKNEKEETALHFAAASRRPGSVDALVSAKAGLNERDRDGNTPLMVATKARDVEAVDVLIRAKANVNAVDSRGRTALHHATKANWSECVLRLIDAKANLDKADLDGDTPYVVAIKCNCPCVLQVLIDAGCDRSSIDGLMGTAVALAAVRGHVDVLTVLLSNDEDPDECGYFGMTPLMLAGFESHTDTVDCLLRMGADPNAKGRMGGMPLHKSLMKLTPSNDRKRHEIVVRLIRAGADVNHRLTTAGYFTSCTNGKNCPLSFAISAGYVSLVRVLLVAGSEVSHDECRDWMQLNNIHRFFEPRQLLEPISSWMSQPRSLKHLCRKVIRASVRSSRLESAIQSLPIATPLKRFLDFEEFEDLVIERADVTQGASPGMIDGFETYNCGLRALEGTLLHQTIFSNLHDP